MIYGWLGLSEVCPRELNAGVPAIVRFLKLLDPYELPLNELGALGKQQQRAHDAFPLLVAHSPLRYWVLGDAIPHVPTRILIGVAASFHLPNLRLLDLICDSIRKGHSDADVVHVLNLDDLGAEPSLEKYFPSLGPDTFFMPPLVGIWWSGQHEQSFYGFWATDYLLKQFHIGMTPAELIDSVRPPKREMMEDVS